MLLQAPVFVVSVRYVYTNAQDVPKQIAVIRRKNYIWAGSSGRAGLRRRSAAPRLQRLWVRIPPEAWMFFCCECCVLSGRGLCDELITRREESYRLWCVVVCDLEPSWMRRSWPTGGAVAPETNKKLYLFKLIINIFYFRSLYKPTPKGTVAVDNVTKLCNRSVGSVIVYRLVLSFGWVLFKFCYRCLFRSEISHDTASNTPETLQVVSFCLHTGLWYNMCKRESERTINCSISVAAIRC